MKKTKPQNKDDHNQRRKAAMNNILDGITMIMLSMNELEEVGTWMNLPFAYKCLHLFSQECVQASEQLK